MLLISLHKALIKLLLKKVLPVPKSPIKQTVVLNLTILANFLAKLVVSLGEFILILQLNILVSFGNRYIISINYVLVYSRIKIQES